MDQLGYREIQNVFKEIARKSMLEKEFRKLCLKDSKTAIQEIIGEDAIIPYKVIFLEEDGGEVVNNGGFAYILPPFLRESWLLSK